MITKKEVTEMSVEQKLQTLYQLQTLLSENDKIKTLRGELPLEVQDLEDEIEGLTLRLGRFNEEIEGLNTEIAKRNSKIEEAQAAVERYKTQLNDVKNNREYDMLSKEIEFQSLEIELQNKKIGEARRQIEAKQEEITVNSTTLQERRADLEMKKSELDEIISETKAEEEKLREKAKNLEMTIDPRLLTAFKRIRKNSRNGLGIVYVERDACGGCFNKIPPQRQLDIRMRKKIIVCEYCGRIMIDPELAGVKVDKLPEEEKPKRRSRRTTGTTAK
ncbi:MAG TPA: C4-type zinc ribbon domain-containing protein [Alloprevotella sp.]|nr:C4-type zinc ribbon domain-containing protein [Alloprevotella sp.]